MIPFRRLRRSLAVFGLVLAAPAAFVPAQAPAAKYADVAESIRTAGLRGEYATRLLERLTSAAGPRLTGSPAAAAAVQWARTTMDEMGAHDDGAGCVQAIEVLRLIRELGLKPKRTVRAVMFMNEEFGASGGRDYAEAGRRKTERHIAAMESDRGAFLPIGFGIGGTPEQFARLQAWGDLLKPSGILWIRPGGGGADTGPLARLGAVLMGFVPDSQKYFDYHHSALDVLSAVHPRELELGAIVMAIFTYVAAQEGI